MNYGRRQARSEGFPATKTIRPPGIRSQKTAVEPGAGSQEEEEEEAEDEDEEEEDPGYGNSGDNDDDDSPPASSHRPVTRSTPKKPVSVLNGRPSGTNPGLGVAPGNGSGGDR